MRSRGELIRFPGYPFDLDTFLPSYRMALYAACLREAGHEVTIRDYGIPSIVDRMLHGVPLDEVRNILDAIHASSRGEGVATSIWNRWLLHGFDRRFRKNRQSICEELATQLVSRNNLDFVIFALDSPDDIEPVAILSRCIHNKCPDLRIALMGTLVDEYPVAVTTSDISFDTLFRDNAEQDAAIWADSLHTPMTWSGIANMAILRNSRLEWTRTEWRHLRGISTPAYDSQVYRTLRLNDTQFRIYTVEDSRFNTDRCMCFPEREALSLKTPDSVFREITDLKESCGAKVFRFLPSLAGSTHATAIAARLLRNRAECRYSRCDSIKTVVPEALQTWVQSGCRAISFQVDTGSQYLHDHFYKQDITISRIECILRESKQQPVHTNMRLSFPCAYDDYHTREETLRLLERTQPDSVLVAWPHALISPLRSFKDSVSDRNGVRVCMSQRRYPVPVGMESFPPFTTKASKSKKDAEARNEMFRRMYRLGRSAHCTETHALICDALGSGEDVNTFTTRFSDALLTGALDTVVSILKTFNQKVASPRIDICDRPSRQLRAAVGN